MAAQSEFFKVFCSTHPGFKSECAKFWIEHKGMEKGDALRDFRHAFPEYTRERRSYDKKQKRLRKQKTIAQQEILFE